MTKKALIIGGGPAGLTAAYELATRTDVQPIVIEMSEFWGGISRTEEKNGNRIDIGGHRFFSKSDEVMEWWQQIMPIQSDTSELEITYQNKTRKVTADPSLNKNDDLVMLVRKRKSRIYSNRKFFNYPVSLSVDTIKKLGYFNTVLIGFSYLKSVFFVHKTPITLEDFFIKRFGKRLYRTFFRDYTEKVWGVPCSEISAAWGEQRIKGLSITKTITSAFKSIRNSKTDINQKNTETSLIEYFLYPKYGPGQLWETVADKVTAHGGILVKNHHINELHFNNDNVSTAVALNKKGEKVTYQADFFISTMPIKQLINSFKTTVPDHILNLANGLLYRDFVTVGILIDHIEYELTDNWIYIQESDVQVGRLQIFNNWSPFMVSDPNKTWVGLEYFCNTSDALWHMTATQLKELAIKELIQLDFIKTKDVVSDSKVIKVPKAYPAYFGSYDQFDSLKKYLLQFPNLYCIGRNGMHKYNNQDHSMLTAMRTVDCIHDKKGDKKAIWDINAEMEYHEEK